jgi:endoglucanase
MLMRLLFLCLYFSATFRAGGQGFLKASGTMIVNGRGEAVLLRGMGLGGWMLQEPYMLRLSGVAPTQWAIRQKIAGLIGAERTAQFYDAWLANHCTRADIEAMANWGFNSVRLPMHYNLFTPPVEEEPVAGQTTWQEKGFQMVDSLLDWCRDNNVYLILDLHAAPGGQGNDHAIADRDPSKPSLWQSEANQQKTVALWRKLAERYKDEEWIGAYDLINEPNWGFQNADDKNGCSETANAPLRALLIDITKAIREVDNNHMIIIEGNCWGNNYKGVYPLWDSNTVISFHKYWNYNDAGSVKGMLDTRAEQNAPVWLGESGENSNAWFTDAITLLESNQIGWAWWPLKKLGHSNPLQIKQNKDYEAIIAYWKGAGPKPSGEAAFRGLMQLANDSRIENNVQHHGVVDALFRQIGSQETLPFKRLTVNNAATVYAVDYDMGRMGQAYHDSDYANYRVSTNKNVEWNKGHQYRNDGVDIKACTDTGSNGYAIGWIKDGEWLQYTLEVPVSGTYQLQLRTATDSASGAVDLRLNGAAVQRNLPLIKGDKGKWLYTTAKPITLKKGTNKLRIYAVKGGFDFNQIKLTKAPRAY